MNARRILAALALGAGLALAGCTTTTPVPDAPPSSPTVSYADPVDYRDRVFLRVAPYTGTSDDDRIRVAGAVCEVVSDPSIPHTVASIYGMAGALQDNYPGLSEFNAGKFIGAAAGTYCPEQTWVQELAS